MRTSNGLTRVDADLQVRLAEYGIMRKDAEEKAPYKAGKPEFFGISETNEGYDTKFGVSMKTLQKSNMTVATLAPDNKTFDLLKTTNFTETIKTADRDSLRAAIRDIVDEA